MDDDDLLDDNSKSIKSKESECASEVAEPSPGPSATSENPALGDGDEKADDFEDKIQWPSANDLNTRLRRVITTYQRNYRKEELKMAAKAKVMHLNLYFIYIFLIMIQHLDFCFFYSANHQTLHTLVEI